MSSRLLFALFAFSLASVPACSNDDPNGVESDRTRRTGKTCGDGTVALCEIVPPTCPEGLVLEEVNHCFGRCVHPVTCQPPQAVLTSEVVALRAGIALQSSGRLKGTDILWNEAGVSVEVDAKDPNISNVHLFDGSECSISVPVDSRDGKVGKVGNWDCE